MREDQFERLYAAHARPLFSFLVYRTGDRELAEDLLADTFERALRARRRFDPRKASSKTWLYSIALNCLRDQARRRAAEGRAMARLEPTGGAEEAEGFGRVELRDALERALGSLSAAEREAVALRFGAELTFPELAKVLGQPLTSVEGRVYRGLRKLRAELAKSPTQP